MFYLGKGSVQAESIQRRFVEELRGPTRFVDALRRSLPVRSFSNRELGKEDPGEKQNLAGIFVVV